MTFGAARRLLGQEGVMRQSQRPGYQVDTCILRIHLSLSSISLEKIRKCKFGCRSWIPGIQNVGWSVFCEGEAGSGLSYFEDASYVPSWTCRPGRFVVARLLK